jgi:hypothetical protein
MAGKSKGSRRIRRNKGEALELTTKWVVEAHLYLMCMSAAPSPSRAYMISSIGGSKLDAL